MITVTLIVFLITPSGHNRVDVAGFESIEACRKEGIRVVQTHGGWDKVRFTCQVQK